MSNGKERVKGWKDIPKFVKKDVKYYYGQERYEFQRGIYIGVYNKVAINDLKRRAIERLISVVENKDLSLGEKIIIRDIALETLEDNLVGVFVDREEEIERLEHCWDVPLRDSARDKLARYGFTIKSFFSGRIDEWTKKPQKVVDFSLRRDSGD